MKSLPLRTSLRASKYLEHVEIVHVAVSDFAASLTLKKDNLADVLFAKSLSHAHAWEVILIFNAMNFCYWAVQNAPKWSIDQKGQTLDGSIALVRLLESEMLEYGNLKHLKDFDHFQKLLQGNVKIPLLEQRYANVLDVFRGLETKYASNPMLFLKNTNFCAVRLRNHLIEDFPSFQDKSSYKGSELFFWKRAQLTAKMWHDYLVSIGHKGLENLHKLTAFADYKVPQLLRHLGILKYSDELAALIDNYTLIEADSELENELRIAAIVAIEQIAKQTKGLTACEIDGLLWTRAGANTDKMLPYHRTYTSAY
jgi:hypothetical protein